MIYVIYTLMWILVHVIQEGSSYLFLSVLVLVEAMSLEMFLVF